MSQLFNDLALMVCAERKMDFVGLVEKGEGSAEYFRHLEDESCAKCQAVIDKAFERSSKSFEALGRELRAKK